MEDIFNMLSSSARIDKSKRKKKKKRQRPPQVESMDDILAQDGNANDEPDDEEEEGVEEKSRDRTGKRDTSEEKLKQVRKEQIAAFRRSMAIRLANKHDPDIPDPISSFHDLTPPTWWKSGQAMSSFWKPMLVNIEAGRWKEPTPIQMQAIPALMHRRDFIGASATGSGKSGAFLLPALLLSSAPYEAFYDANNNNTSDDADNGKKKKKKSKKNEKKQSAKNNQHQPVSRQGEIRGLVVAPTLELASQLHREVERLGQGKPGGVASLLLSKSNAANVIAGSAGGKNGLDILVTTPLRIVDSIEKGLRLDAVRIVCLDEVDRLFDAADGSTPTRHPRNQNPDDSSSEEENRSDSEEDDDGDKKPKAGKNKGRNPKQRQSKDNSTAQTQQQSGSSQTKSFLAQMDVILDKIPPTAARCLFSATVTPMVRSLAESALRNPIDVTIAAPGTHGGANTDIDQQLMFVGREEGKLLAMRQLAQRGQLKPPVIVFTQSQDRAQALFGELLYDGMHVDVIHAGRSKAARDNAVAKFRRGDTWVLIATDLVARGVDFKSINMVINYDLPTSGISYVHRIGRTGRAGRKGTAITLFTEADFEHLRTIANVMKQSGCKVEDWMLNLQRNNNRRDKNKNPWRNRIDTSHYDRKKKRSKQQQNDNESED
ncbi:Probable ATP-dependent RNA helicase DDX52 [Seminavis robusta]|uniref:RNA helicase n=1 Tax=Seminavis robusta TaxID=568900 RepID=A0A9N8HUJ5_9STRA|nr:Probable ATP-dependent RNA helicase DDX52 [Seminavis robusta]|eukprot:Sro1828_g300190.1 Probable ATP-dependent RNA helicase DDX52 (656) ;mRNA; r:8652-10619